jgi:hypothetical protein
MMTRTPENPARRAAIGVRRSSPWRRHALFGLLASLAACAGTAGPPLVPSVMVANADTSNLPTLAFDVNVDHAEYANQEVTLKVQTVGGGFDDRTIRLGGDGKASARLTGRCGNPGVIRVRVVHKNITRSMSKKHKNCLKDLRH